MEKWAWIDKRRNHVGASNHDHGGRDACSYVGLRNNILAVFRRAQPVLNEIKAKIHTGDFELPVEKLEREEFTLTLIGAFQSGKSTLFSYLCDARELSKVGVGLRTTGCCVAATALPEGMSDYAEVTWFDEDEIKAAIGDCTGKQEDEIRLRNRAWCRRFEQELLDTAKSVAQGRNEQKKQNETLPVLLMLHFFNEYRERCKKTVTFPAWYDVCFFNEYREKCNKNAKERMSALERAVVYTCYPNKWEQRWQGVNAVSDIDHFFKPEDAAFAFCKRIDYYIDSPTLRTLGCTVQDCPGMFASKRDSDLTREIIQKSDAIFYVISGDKGLGNSDRDCIRECGTLDTSNRIIFGVNLHSSFQNWKETIEPEVISQLKNLGIRNPKVFHYHAPLALHSRELFRLLCNDLHQVSKKAIQDCIDASKSKSDTPEKYLRERINFWMGRLDGGEGDCLDNYCDGRSVQWKKLTELHRGDELIRFLKTEKARILLQVRGIGTASEIVDRIYVHLGKTIEKLNLKNKADKEEEKEKKNNMRSFRSTMENVEQIFETELATSLQKLSTVIAARLEKVEWEVIAKIKDYATAYLFIERERDELIKLLEDEVNEILTSVRDERFPGIYSSIVQKTQGILDKNAEKLREFANHSLTGIEMPPLRFEEYEAPRCSIPTPPFKGIYRILKNYEGDLLTALDDFCGSSSGDEIRSLVLPIWNEIKLELLTIMLRSVNSMLRSYVSGAMSKIKSSAKKLDGVINDTYSRDMKSLQKAIEKNEIEIRECIFLREQLDNIRSEFNKLEDQVKEFFVG